MAKPLIQFLVVLVMASFFIMPLHADENTPLFPVYACKGGFGFINADGKLVIPPQFSFVNPFVNGIARVEINDKYSYIDKTGKFITAQKFAEANDFSEGLAKVKVGDLWGYIDTNGKMVIKSQFSWATDFSEGWAVVIPNGQQKTIYINKTGQVVLSPNPTYDFELNKLLAEERDGLTDPQVEQSRYVDKQGKTHVRLTCFYSPFKNGLARMDCGVLGAYSKTGYINKSGKVVWSPMDSCANQPTGP